VNPSQAAARKMMTLATRNAAARILHPIRVHILDWVMGVAGFSILGRLVALIAVRGWEYP
jgi:hypothetical protein